MGVSTTETMDLNAGVHPDNVAFWEQQALRLDWDTPWHTAHRWNPADREAGRGPGITWFEGGKLNVAAN